MNNLEHIVKIGLYAMMFASAIAAFAVVLLPNLFHAALALAVTLIGVAGIFLALQADFLAVAQILIYVGAVLTLIVFAIMLTERFGDKNIPQNNCLGLWAFSAVIILIVLLWGIIKKTAWPVQPENLHHHVTVADLGKALMTTYVLPFEVISIILVAVLIGAVIVARKDEKEA